MNYQATSNEYTNRFRRNGLSRRPDIDTSGMSTEEIEMMKGRYTPTTEFTSTKYADNSGVLAAAQDAMQSTTATAKAQEDLARNLQIQNNREIANAILTGEVDKDRAFNQAMITSNGTPNVSHIDDQGYMGDNAGGEQPMQTDVGGGITYPTEEGSNAFAEGTMIQQIQGGGGTGIGTQAVQRNPQTQGNVNLGSQSKGLMLNPEARAMPANAPVTNVDYSNSKLSNEYVNNFRSLDLSKASENTKIAAVHAAFMVAGFSRSQAAALTGEVGRENSFQSKYLFGTHNDPAKNSSGGTIKNLGFFSWNGNRRKNLENFMAQRGLLNRDGSIVKSFDSLVAMAQFAKQEMNSGYSKHLGYFFSNPDADPETFAKSIGRNYIGWAYGQDTIRGKNGQRVSFNWRKGDQVRRNYMLRALSLSSQAR